MTLYITKTGKVDYSYNNQAPTVSNYSYQEPMTDNRPSPVHTKRAKWRPPTAYYRNIEEGFTKGCSLSGTLNRKDRNGYTEKATVSGSFAFSGYYGDPIDSPAGYLTNQCLIKCRNKLKSFGEDENYSLDLATALAERKQTERLTVDTVKKLAKAIRAARRLDAVKTFQVLGLLAVKGPKNRRRKHYADSIKRLRAKTWKSPHELWLAAQYGWKPLLSDCYTSAIALYEAEKERTVLTARVVSTAKDGKNTSKLVSQVIGTFACRCRKHLDVKHKVKVRLDYVKSNSPLTPLAQLGLTNPLNVAWELVPFSFVVDWFIPVGAFLSSLDASIGWTFKGGTLSITTTQKSWAEVRDYSTSESGGTAITGALTCSGKGRQFQFTRSVYSSEPFPTMPSFKPSASGLHVANGIALLLSAVSGGKRLH